jgi:L-ascorbate metabolism protein UlaG (beta-lactamase superfamily)
MLKKLLKFSAITLITVVLLFAGWLLSQPGMDEVGIAYVAPSGATGDHVTVQWLGFSTLLIDDGETQIMTDGFFSRPSLIDMATDSISPDEDAIKQALNDLGTDRLKAVFPVHSHYDHALDTGVVANLTGAIVLGSESTANIARSSAVPESQILVIQTETPYQFGKFTVTFFGSEHAPLPTNAGIGGIVTEPFKLPAPYTAWQLGQAFSIHIAHPEGSMLIQGSAGFVKGALKDVNADVIFLGAGGLSSLPANYQQKYIFETVTQLQPRLVIPIHHDSLFGTYGEVDQSRLMVVFDQTSAFELKQRVLPAELRQMRFAEPIAIFQ